MQKYSDLEYLKLNKWHKFTYKLLQFLIAIPLWFKNLGIKIWNLIKRFGRFIASEVKDIVMTFVKGDWKTKTSYVVMGFGSAARGQILRGLLFFLFEVVFILYMILVGSKYLPKFGTLGDVETYDEIHSVLGIEVKTTIYGDDSFKILLYGTLSIVFIIAFIYTWRLNIKQNRICEEILATGKKLKSGKDDVNSLLDDQFHKTLLALPTVGIFMFTVLPILFMILVAFTNYDSSHNPPNNLFTWVGMDNFNEILGWSNGKTSFSATFGELLTWTLIWAFFATFTNYFLGMLVAMMINKKGIKLKKVWRTFLVISIAIPQFISLLYVSKMFTYPNGIINEILYNLFGKRINFFGGIWSSRITVIIINIWIGIPYLMLITTGVLMNIPADLYESARIDGASPWKMYTKITLPYMLFVTGPYLLTSFTGNMNNFNVIYLLTGGEPIDTSIAAAKAGHSDLLVTWLYKLTVNDRLYRLAAVIGILVFVVVAVISLIVYNLLPSMKNEEDFQ